MTRLPSAKAGQGADVPISLPPGEVPSFKALTNDGVLTSGLRVTGFRFELLDNDEIPIGELAGVTGGYVEWSASASVKGSGQLNVTDLQELISGKPLDWLNTRIRPVCVIEGFDREIPLGIWTAAAPTEDWTSTGRTWNVDLLDKASILDRDIWVNRATGTPETFTALSSDNLVDLVRGMITDVGESTVAIDNDPTLVGRDMVWEVGTTRLKIINDLLDAGGFFSLWVDPAGQFRVSKYTRPADRPPVYEASGAFTVGPTSVMSPDLTVERDIYGVPNRFVAIGQGEADTAARVATAVNMDPDSPYSYISRGRWITQVESGVESVDQAALQTYADRRLAVATAVTTGLTLKHAFMPDVWFNSTVRVINPETTFNLLMTITKVHVPLDALEFSSTDLREVTDL